MYVFRNLFAEMARKHYTHEDMARELKMARPTFSKKIRGYSEFTFSEIQTMIKLFNQSFEYLFKIENFN